MKIISILITITVAAFFFGCASTNEHLGTINTSDIAEADFLRQILGQDPDANGNFRVEPGSQVTTVHISTPSKPENEASLRASLTHIKNEMKQVFGREPNTLRFVFKEVTIEE